jgi:trans-2,3-dihydro-3-hydroxyanthranilate isomerase
VARPLTWLDVFTDTPLTGNQLAVVHDADGLDDATMLAFARETKLSETTFVQPSSEGGADYRNRIFMTTGELPFAGHPSLGTAVAVALAAGERAVEYVQETGAGLQPIEVEHVDGDVWRAAMLQDPATHGAEQDAEQVLRAVGLDAGAAHPELPAQVVSTGTPHLIAPVRDAALLADARPDFGALGEVLGTAGVTTVYLVAAGDGHARARARAFFCDTTFAAEDPATGSAAGPLCAYMHARAGLATLDIAQGVEMGRPSVLRCAMQDDGRVRVAGDCVVVVTGSVAL